MNPTTSNEPNNPGVVGFIQGRCVRSGTTWGSLGSFVVVGFIWVRPGGVCVHSGTIDPFESSQGVGCRIHSGKFGCALWFILVRPGVGWYIRCRYVHSCAPWGSLGSLWFIRVCPGGHGCALVVVGFILGRCVHSDTPWGSLGSFEVVGFMWVRRWVHSGSLGSLGCPVGVVGFIGGLWVRSGAPWGSFGFIRG